MPTPTRPRTPWLESILGDVRFALRYFAHHRATVAILITVLALGTGANAMIFSVFQAEFLRPPPAVPADGAVARIWARERPTTTSGWEPRGFTHAELQTLARERAVFADVAGWTTDDVILGGGDSTGARGAGAHFVTPNYFAALGVRLAAGPGFTRDATGPDMAAVLAHAMAMRIFGDPATAIGCQVLVNGVPLRVAGVAPPRFQGALRNMDEPALWVPVSARAAVTRTAPSWLTEAPALSLFGRLASGASRDRATAVATQIVTRTLPDTAAASGMARTAEVGSMRAPPPGQREGLLIALTAIVVIGGLILLVAWTNVSSLMVAAAVARRHEIAVRLSLGASRVRLLRQLVTESTLLAVTGGTLGLIVAWWVLVWSAKTEIDGVDIVPDAGTFAFVLGLSVASGILFGLSPALHATRTGVSGAMRDSGRTATGGARLQRGFVAAQIALSQPLLVLLGTMLSLVIVEYRPLAPEMASRVAAVDFHPLPNGSPGQRPEAVAALVPRLAGRAEVERVAPDAAAFSIRAITAPTDGTGVPHDSAPTVVHLEGAAPGWFALVEIPILLGRDVAFTDTAAIDHPVLIGSDLARSLWGAANPVGRTLASPPLLEGQDALTFTVVGVYDATRRMPGMTWDGAATRTNAPARVFTARGAQWRTDRLLVRTFGPAAPALPGLQRFLRAEAPALPVTGMRTLAQADELAWRETVQVATWAGAGGLVALLVASLGLYGVVSLAVQQRTREIGIRIAVGAHPMQVARMFLASGVRVSTYALLLGLPLSIAGLQVAMSRGLVIAPGVSPLVIGSGIAVLLIGVAAAATWIPARRAARVDPAITLRQD